MGSAMLLVPQQDDVGRYRVTYLSTFFFPGRSSKFSDHVTKSMVELGKRVGRSRARSCLGPVCPPPVQSVVRLLMRNRHTHQKCDELT